MPRDMKFDVVAANILRGPLVELQPRLTAYAAPGMEVWERLGRAASEAAAMPYGVRGAMYGSVGALGEGR
eukprot:366279-Chlamydomonas_euryale.AAC.19